MSEMTTLPAVAQRFYTDCKKCGVERYHVVLAHTNATSAKIECEVCHAKRQFKLPSKQAKKRSAVKPSAKKIALSRWDEVKDRVSEGSKVAYNMKQKFSKDTTLQHPKFGLGLIVGVTPQSIEVVFEDTTRSLVHNRV